MSSASFSALERSVDGGRVRKFSADDLLALSRTFKVPIGWFLTPPARNDGIDVATADHPEGTHPELLLDAVLGTDETLDAWRDVLKIWPSMTHRAERHDNGTVARQGRAEVDVHDRLDELTTMRAHMAIREQFGDIDTAIDTLARVQSVLAHLNEPTAPSGPISPGPAARKERRK
ncbi:MAG: hypothetical protein ACKV2O_09350 [Acidimicrobiales bacterium]